MRRIRIRIDFAIPMLIGFGVGALINWGGGKVIDEMELASKEVVYSDTQIGAAPTKNVPVVSSIAEMQKQDYFTFHVMDEFVGFDDSVYYDGTIYDVYTLESGELVLVDDYYLHSYYDHDESDDSWWADYYLVMPIGQIVNKPVNEEIINALAENGYILSDTSFYVDMRGEFEEFSRDDWEGKVEGISFLVGFIVFIFIRYLMIASGIFPPLFPLRFLKKWKRFIIYYGVIYYDENVAQIHSYYKKKKYAEAAEEFAKLTGVPLSEAQEALNYWNDIYGEGILRMAKNK